MLVSSATQKRKMVRPEGFEPPTNGFGSHYSIRLSYERMMLLATCRRSDPGHGERPL